MEDDKIITLRRPGEIGDPLTEVLRNGAHVLLAQAVEAEVAEALAAHTHIWRRMTATGVWCVTDICRNGRSRPVSGR